MLNREKYAEEIIEIACNGGNIAVVNGKLENCRKTQCNECNFNGGTIRDCEIKTRKWANSEYVEPIEPQVDWSRVPVDTPILVRHRESCGWDRRYFAKYNNGLVYAWKQGTTSWSAEDPAYVCDWKYAKLAESEESMIECIRTAARDSKTERIKVSCLDIIVTMIGKKPYYEIKYKEIGEDYYHVGYSSYKLENVLAWRDECFELVRDTRTNADWIRSMTDEELLDFLCSIETYEQGSVKTIKGGVAMCSVTEVEQWLRAESEG